MNTLVFVLVQNNTNQNPINNARMDVHTADPSKQHHGGDYVAATIRRVWTRALDDSTVDTTSKKNEQFLA